MTVFLTAATLISCTALAGSVYSALNARQSASAALRHKRETVAHTAAGRRTAETRTSHARPATLSWSRGGGQLPSTGAPRHRRPELEPDPVGGEL